MKNLTAACFAPLAALFRLRPCAGAKTTEKWLVGLACSLALATGAFAQSTPGIPGTPTPGLDEILRRVEAATRVPNGYSAAAHQTVTRASRGAAVNATGAPEEVLADENYRVSCSEAGDARATARLSPPRTAVQNPAATGPSAGRTLHGGLLTVNPLNALRHVAGMAAPTVVDDPGQSVPSYKISAGDSHYQFVLWVGKADSSVHRLIVQQGPLVVYDTTFQYTNWSGHLVPARVEINSPASGAKTVQEFSGHAF